MLLLQLWYYHNAICHLSDGGHEQFIHSFTLSIKSSHIRDQASLTSDESYRVQQLHSRTLVKLHRHNSDRRQDIKKPNIETSLRNRRVSYSRRDETEEHSAIQSLKIASVANRKFFSLDLKEVSWSRPAVFREFVPDFCHIITEPDGLRGLSSRSQIYFLTKTHQKSGMTSDSTTPQCQQ